MSLSRFDEAGAAFHNARTSLEKLLALAPEDENLRYRLAAVENNEASSELELGNARAAVEHFGRAIRLLGQLRKGAADVINYRRDQANSMQHLAGALARLGRTAEAVDTGRQAIARFKELAEDYPTIPTFRYELAAAHHNLGMALVSAFPESAREEFHRSILTLEPLTRLEPTNINYLHDLANSHMWLGDTERVLRRFDESASEFTRARDLYEKAALVRPEDPGARYKLAACEHNCASTFAEAGRLDLAEERYRRSQQLLNVLAAQYPQSIQYRRDLANSTLELGHCLLARRDRSGGNAELTRALEHWDALLARSRENPGFVEGRGRALVLLGRFDEGTHTAGTLAALSADSGRNLYQAACLLAFNLPRPGPDLFAAARTPAERATGLAERAFGFLTRSLGIGYGNLKLLETDGDLDALRSRAEYGRLIDLLLDRGFPANPFVR